MDLPILIVTSLILICVITLVFLYISNEKKKKVEREAEIQEIKQILTTFQNRIQDSSSQLSEKFEILSKDLQTVQDQANAKIKSGFEYLQKDVRTAQNQANAKINSGFEQLQNESINVQKNVRDNIAEIKTLFKEYSEKVNDALKVCLDDNSEFKKDTEKLKTKIQSDLQNILKEIKTPLDLD